MILRLMAHDARTATQIFLERFLDSSDFPNTGINKTTNANTCINTNTNDTGPSLPSSPRPSATGGNGVANKYQEY